MFCVWPFHLSTALGLTTTLTVHGYGTTTVACQAAALILFAVVAIYFIRKSEFGAFMKTALVAGGYFAVVLLTNLAPVYL